MGFADGFAVPACAFGVEVVEGLLVDFACPFESGGEFCFVDFVVVVDEFAGLGDGVDVVGWWGELVRVPGEVDVEGWDGGSVGVQAHNGDVAIVFEEESGHGGCHCGGMEPVDGVHFFDKGPLADDGSYEVDGERRGVFPVAGHHSADGRSLFAGCGDTGGIVSFLDVVLVG